MPTSPAPVDMKRIERAAASLTSLEFEVLSLSAGERLWNREIAIRLGLSRRKVERILARALRNVDRALHDEERSWWRFW